MPFKRLYIKNAAGKAEPAFIRDNYVKNSAGNAVPFTEGDLKKASDGIAYPILRDINYHIGVRVSGSNMTFIPTYAADTLTNPKMVIHGSSTAAGFELGPTQTIQYKVTQYGTANWGGITMNNVSQTGADSSMFLPVAMGGTPGITIDDALAYQPDIIIFFAPSNDVSAGNTTQEWIDNITFIKQRAEQAGTRFYLQSPGPRTAFSLADQNKLVEASAAFLSDPEFTYNIFDYYNSDLWLKNDPANPAKSNPIYYQGDNIHLNDAGTTYVVNNLVIPVLERELRPNTAYTQFIIQRSVDEVSGWTNYNTITDTQLTSVTLTKQSGYYRILAYLKDGSFRTSNVVQVTNTAPTANAGSDQVLAAGTTTTNVTGSGSDPDGSIVSYLWEVISGSASLTNANTATVTVNGLTDGNSYTLRLTVTDNNGSTGQDTMGITVGAIAAQRILFDLGGDGTSQCAGCAAGGTMTPNNTIGSGNKGQAGDGKWWNNLVGNSGPLTWFTNPVDINNNIVSGFSLSVDKDTGGTFNVEGDKSLNYTGYVGALSDYPATATIDNYYYHNSAGIVSHTFTIPAGRTMSIKWWGSRSNAGGAAGPRILQFRVGTSGTFIDGFDSFQNSSYTQAYTLTGLSGTVVIQTQVKAGGAGFGHVGILDITLT